MCTPQKHIAPDNLNKICRVCLEEKPLILKLSSMIQIEGEESPPSSIANLLDKIFPHQKMINIRGAVICLDCFTEFKIVLFFYEKCKQSCFVFKRFFDDIQKDTLEDMNYQTSIFIGSNEETGRNFSIEETNLPPAIIKETIKENKPPVNSIDLKSDPQTSIVKVEKPDEPVGKMYKDFRRRQTCPICFEEFEMVEFRKHIQNHKSLKRYLSIPRSLRVSPNAKFTCSRSENAPVTQVPLNARLVKLHKCPHCDLELSTSAFKTHIRTHQKKGEFACDKCDRVFHGMNHLLNHKIFCQSTERPYTCKICAKGFTIKKNYDCHLLLHTDTELPYQCRICLLRFSNPIHFKRHKHPENETSLRKSVRYKQMCTRISNINGRAHENDLSRKCDICSKVFFKPGSYYRHMYNDHNARSSLLCWICGVSVRSTNYEYHMRVHNNEKPFQCTECGKKYRTSTHLQRHLMIHSGLRPFICCSCGKAFNNASNLKMHELIHTGVKNHKCRICGKRFLANNALTKHLKSHQSLL